jgi:hypothetical protein
MLFMCPLQGGGETGGAAGAGEGGHSHGEADAHLRIHAAPRGPAGAAAGGRGHPRHLRVRHPGPGMLMHHTGCMEPCQRVVTQRVEAQILPALPWMLVWFCNTSSEHAAVFTGSTQDQHRQVPRWPSAVPGCHGCCGTRHRHPAAGQCHQLRLPAAAQAVRAPRRPRCQVWQFLLLSATGQLMWE